MKHNNNNKLENIYTEYNIAPHHIVKTIHHLLWSLIMDMRKISANTPFKNVLECS